MSRELKAAVEAELASLKELLEFHKDLITRLKQSDPTLVEKEALAAVLQSFYGGLEILWRTIVEDSGLRLAKSDSWHMDLLSRMKAASGGGTALIGPDLFIKLRAYLKFRHRMRQGYSTKLEWLRMKELVFEMGDVFDEVESSLKAYLARQP